MSGMQGTELHYEYKGYEYRTYDDIEEDNIKTFHMCFRDGHEVKLDYAFYNHSPYSLVSRQDFEQFVDDRILVDFVTV